MLDYKHAPPADRENRLPARPELDRMPPTKETLVQDRGLMEDIDAVRKEPWLFVQKLGPYFTKAADGLEMAVPYIGKASEKLQDVWKCVQPYKPMVWGPTVFGIILVFFGGRFLTTVAAVEAVRMIGFANLKSHTLVLWDNYQKAREAAKKDEGADGETKEHKGQRVATVVLKAVDPQEITGAVAGVYEIMLAVVATLRFKFAAAVTLGCSIGDMFQTAANAYAKPHLEASIPREHHKWIEPCITYGCKATGITLAWLLQRVMSAMHCSIRGAYIIVIAAQKALVELKFLDKVKITEDNPYFTLIVSLIAMAGFVNQVAYGFGLPFPLSFFFLPIYIVEWSLTFCVGAV